MPRRATRTTVAVLIAAASLVVGCSSPSTGTEVRSHDNRADPDPGTSGATALANSSLGADLYRALARRGGNFVFSPVGVSVGLAMPQAGAAGTTATQLAAVQHITPGLDLDVGLGTVLQRLDDRSGERSSDLRKGKVNLAIPVGLWGQKNTRYRSSFLDDLASSFDVGVRTVDLRSDPEAGRRAMNAWVRDQTRDQIPELIPRGGVTDVSRLLVTEAAWLSAPWEEAFDRSRTHPSNFTLLDGQTVNPPTMSLSAPTGLGYAKSDGWQAIELPYLGRELSMVVVVPDQGRFGDVESAFDGAELQRVLGLLGPKPIDLMLPRFGFTTQGNLAEPLTEIGAPSAFSPKDADFSGITDDEALSISSFAHQTFLSADEEGTQATASTVSPSSTATPEPRLTSVIIDRPFLVMVVDRTDNEPLFLGRVINPAG